MAVPPATFGGFLSEELKPTTDELRAAIGRKATDYLELWADAGEDQFSAVATLGPAWLAYRKMYGQALYVLGVFVVAQIVADAATTVGVYLLGLQPYFREHYGVNQPRVFGLVTLAWGLWCSYTGNGRYYEYIQAKVVAYRRRAAPSIPDRPSGPFDAPQADTSSLADDGGVSLVGAWVGTVGGVGTIVGAFALVKAAHSAARAVGIIWA